MIMTAAAMLLGAGLAVTTAKAEMNFGPTTDSAKGLCFQKAASTDPGFFGYWTECPKPAATATAAPAAHRRHVKHSEKDTSGAQ
jgi:hypothetical protein